MTTRGNQLNQHLKVLVVDGLQESLTAVALLLRELGFLNIETTTDGARALEKVLDGQVELLIADWSIPQVSGLELLTTIRAQDDLAGLPIVMTAAMAERENLVAAICAGASSLLVLSDDIPALKESLRLRLETVFDVDPFQDRVRNNPY